MAMHFMKQLLLFGVVLSFICFMYHSRTCPKLIQFVNEQTKMEYYEKVHIGQYTYDRNSPFIFIGGLPRSGCSLMRVMLDIHPDIRCSKETFIIDDLLKKHDSMMASGKEAMRIEEAGITNEIFDSANAAFILEFIVNDGKPAPLLCNNDYLNLLYGVYISKLFPSSKFLLMVRDGRAIANSIFTDISNPELNITIINNYLKFWNDNVKTMDRQCREIGSHRCLTIRYEQLVLNPRKCLKKIFNFLNVSWFESVLHHEDFIKNGEIQLAGSEKLSGEIFKPINTDRLDKWVHKIPDDVLADTVRIAPMLSVMGYDTKLPLYAKLENDVRNDNNQFEQNDDDNIQLTYN